jgi:uncharacterized protein (DUF1330 family)
MAKGYWIVHVTVTDPEGYPSYVAAGAAAYEKFGARFLVRGGRFEAAEGAARERHVVVEFESFEQALACYHSPEYQAAAELRHACAQSELVIVEGFK